MLDVRGALGMGQICQMQEYPSKRPLIQIDRNIILFKLSLFPQVPPCPFLSEFQFSALTKLPLLPGAGPAMSSFNGLYADIKFLATQPTNRSRNFSCQPELESDATESLSKQCSIFRTWFAAFFSTWVSENKARFVLVPKKVRQAPLALSQIGQTRFLYIAAPCRFHISPAPS